LGMSRIARRAL